MYKYKKFYPCLIKFFLYDLFSAIDCMARFPSSLIRYKLSMQYYAKFVYKMILMSLFCSFYYRLLFPHAIHESRTFRGSKIKFPSLVTLRSFSPYLYFSFLVENLLFPTQYLIIDELPRGSFSRRFFFCSISTFKKSTRKLYIKIKKLDKCNFLPKQSNEI